MMAKRCDECSGAGATDREACIECLARGWVWEDGAPAVECPATNHPLSRWVAEHIERYGTSLPCGRYGASEGACPGCLRPDEQVAHAAREHRDRAAERAFDISTQVGITVGQAARIVLL